MGTHYGYRGNSNLDGSTSAKAAKSAMHIKNIKPSATDGVYWIDLPTVGPTQIYCIMDSAYNGGGWMMMMKATTGTTFSYSSSYWTTANTLNPTDVTRNNADAKYDTMNYFAAKDLMAIWPDVAIDGGGIPGLGVFTWLENNFNLGKRQAPISFFSAPSARPYTPPSGGGSGYFVQDATKTPNWRQGVFSSQTDIRFYGFNYVGYNGAAPVRWGFGWNENGEGLFPSSTVTYSGTNDVSGGIGMSWGGGAGISAGDIISCCQNTTGINRQARVEVYIR